MSRQFLRIAVQIFVIAAFAIWFGGFGFYAAIVVPIGTDVLGSAFDQGMITRQVTTRLNVFCGIAAVGMWLEVWVNRRNEQRRMVWLKLAAIVVISIGWIALWFLHPRMDAMIDGDAGTLSDAKNFYSLHRVYLWICTLQWVAGWLWLAQSCVERSEGTVERARPSK